MYINGGLAFITTSNYLFNILDEEIRNNNNKKNILYHILVRQHFLKQLLAGVITKKVEFRNELKRIPTIISIYLLFVNFMMIFISLDLVIIILMITHI